MTAKDRTEEFRWRASGLEPRGPRPFLRVTVASAVIAGVIASSSWVLPRAGSGPTAGAAAVAQTETEAEGASIAAMPAQPIQPPVETHAGGPPSGDDASDADAGATQEQAEPDEPLVVPAVREPQQPPGTADLRASSVAKPPAQTEVRPETRADAIEQREPTHAAPRRALQARRKPPRVVGPQWRTPDWRERAFGSPYYGRRVYRDREIVWERRRRRPLMGFGMY